jgi:sterol desaturase/sphingolipid hydroxylase (fatty acid hydroxylase superfamily)
MKSQSETESESKIIWSPARKIFSVLVFPVVFGGAIAWAIALMRAGVEPQTAFLIPTGAALVTLALLELGVPYCEAWRRADRDVRVDIGHLLVSGGLTLELLRPLMLYLALSLGSWLSRVLSPDLWPSSWPLVIQLVWALIIGEFFLYWVHRLAHEWDFLWRFHALHHSAPRLYFLNAVRFHPVDLAISNFAPFIPLIALGAGPEVMALFTLASAVHGLFQHTNLPMKLGPLNWFFAMAELHRWHHSTILEEANSNFGQNLIVWDIVFGTRNLPKDREPPEKIGINGMPNFPMRYWGQLMSPIQWQRIKRESRENQAA